MSRGLLGVFCAAPFAALAGGCAPSALIGYDKVSQAPDASQQPAEDASDEEPDAAAPLDAAPALDAEADPDAMAAVDAAPADAATDARAALGPWTTLPWRSGVHYGNEPPTYDLFATFRGRALDVVTLYVDRNTWAGLVNPDWWYNNFRNYPARIVLSEPLFPVAPTTLGNLADCAAGTYDAEWRKLGTFLAARAADTIIRLGWGPNDPTHEWRAGSDPAEYISCFRRAVAAIRSTAPRVQIDFSIDPIASTIPASGNPYDLYPGDDVVDIVGMDVFDRLPALRTDADWSAKCNAPLGLCTLIAFARAHNKRFSVGEWGVTACGEQPGGDNPFFIEKMVQTFADNADVLAYEAYFDDPGDEVCSQLYSPSVAPNARAEYQRLYQRR